MEQPLEVNTLEDLISLEPQIVERINIIPNGGRLFMADPIRLLKEINVNLTPKATRQLQQKLGAEDLASNPLKRLYDDFKKDGTNQQDVTVTIKGIIPKEGSHNAG
jgi:hypothetical protein